MSKNKFIYSFIVLFSYLIVTLSWLTFYVFLGEDIELNSIELYQCFTNFTMIYLMIVAVHICFIDNKNINVIMSGVGLIIIPLLIAGYSGAIGIEMQSDDLIASRFITMSIHSVVYIICAIKLTRVDRIFRESKEDA